MKKFLTIFAVLAGLGVVLILAVILLTPWMDRWGATDDEVTAALPGDELVPNPAENLTRVITIQAAPGAIFPWLIQMGAEKGGMYSYSWLETYLLRCELINADRIHPEWQDLKVGDKVKMCPGDWGPVPYEVAAIEPDRALVLGHQEHGEWVESWQFVLSPSTDGSTRLVMRSRTMLTGGIWSVMHPGIFIMQRGMLLGIKVRAEGTRLADLPPAVTPTPEIYLPLDPSPTPSGSGLPLTCQVTDLNVYIDPGDGYCFAYPIQFTLGEQPSDKPDVLGPAIGSPYEPVYATFRVESVQFDAAQSLDQQVDRFLKDFTVVELDSMTRTPVTVGGEAGLMVEPIPVQLSWRIIFLPHGERLYRLMYWPVDLPEAKADLDELTQVTIGSFEFLK